MIVDRNSSAPELFAVVEHYYSPGAIVTFTTLDRKLVNLRLPKCEGLAELYAGYEYIACRMKELVQPVSQEKLPLVLLPTLPEDYESLKGEICT